MRGPARRLRHKIHTIAGSNGNAILTNSPCRHSSEPPLPPYRYFARQSQSDGKRWERIGNS